MLFRSGSRGEQRPCRGPRDDATAGGAPSEAAPKEKMGLPREVWDLPSFSIAFLILDVLTLPSLRLRRRSAERPAKRARAVSPSPSVSTEPAPVPLVAAGPSGSEESPSPPPATGVPQALLILDAAFVDVAAPGSTGVDD